MPALYDEIDRLRAETAELNYRLGIVRADRDLLLSERNRWWAIAETNLDSFAALRAERDALRIEVATLRALREADTERLAEMTADRDPAARVFAATDGGML